MTPALGPFPFDLEFHNIPGGYAEAVDFLEEVSLWWICGV